MIPPFETTFAVPLSCEACIKDVSKSLYELDGIHNVTASLQTNLVSVTGVAAPSTIVTAIERTGRAAILRGSGHSDAAAAVCILETHAPRVRNPVRGLIRMVQVAPALTVLDVSLQGVGAGRYAVSVRATGDISRGAESVGGVWEGGAEQGGGRGVLGTVEVGRGGAGSVFWDRPVRVWEMIGRAVVVSRQREGEELRREDPDTLVGVVARSAGVWDNEKTVCSCSGKTVWEERKEQQGRGML